MNFRVLCSIASILIFFSCFELHSQEFSESERTWLDQHPVITMGVGTGFPPIQFVESRNGQDVFDGIAKDYISEISRILGIEFKAITGISFSEALDRGKSGDIDLFPCIAYSEERDSFLDFTEPYLVFPLVIFARADAPYIGALYDLVGLRVADIKSLYAHQELKRMYPDINFVYADNVEEAMGFVATGLADAHVTNLAAGSYLIQHNNWQSIKVAAPTSFDNTQLRMGVRKGLEPLVPLLEKALNAIPGERKNEIQQKWMPVRFEYGITPEDVLHRTLLIIAGVLVLFLIFIAWIIGLRRQINYRKTIELELKNREQNLKILLKEKEILLKEVYHRIKNNLAMVSSLINLQLNEFDEPKSVDLLQTLDNRIQSITSLHELLYKSESLSEINFKEYVNELVENFYRIMPQNLSAKIQYNTNTEDIVFDSSRVIPLGLIITELVTNALKYAFPETRTGQISINMDKIRNSYSLSVKDNGISIKKEIKIEETTSLGFRLVDILTEQLQGHLEIKSGYETEDGTEVAITFPA